MPNDDHIAQLKKGVAVWNAWRDKNPTCPNLSGADVRGALLSEADLSWATLHRANLTAAHLDEANISMAQLREANLTGANLRGAVLTGANLLGAVLSEANLRRADLRKANLSGTNLGEARLCRADLSWADLSGADLGWARLREANLSRASLVTTTLVSTDLASCDLTGCRIHGVSAWRVELDDAKQQNLIITPKDEPEITVDNVEVAQFIDLLVHKEKIRHVIDTITSKVVLILGRFTDERKAVLDALREELRKRDYLPMLFDFEKPFSRTADETIALLARMARFVIADLSDAKSVLQELRGIAPDLPSVAIQPLILTSQQEPGMFDFFRSYPWVLQPCCYDSQERLLANLEKGVVDPAEAKVLELRKTYRGAFGPTLTRADGASLRETTLALKPPRLARGLPPTSLLAHGPSVSARCERRLHQTWRAPRRRLI
jgi:uncharacterized protein YjbI with pentapeptide repeats